MSHISQPTFYILTPPEFEYMPGLFTPDLQRARLIANLAMLVEDHRRKGYDVIYDTGSDGLTAKAQAEKLKRLGVKNAAVVGADCDRTGVTVLTNALKNIGIETGDAHISECDGEDLLASLESRISSFTKHDKSLDIKTGSSTCFLIHKKDERFSSNGVVFVRDGDTLTPVGPLGAGSVPARLNKIRLFKPDDEIRSYGDDSIYVFCAPSAEPVNIKWRQTCAKLIDIAGHDKFRLYLSANGSCSNRSFGGAQWAARYGFASPAFRDFLCALVAEFIPDQACQLNVVLGMYETGVDPIEEIYEGNALVDRNAELIVNIVK